MKLNSRLRSVATAIAATGLLAGAAIGVAGSATAAPGPTTTTSVAWTTSTSGGPALNVGDKMGFTFGTTGVAGTLQLTQSGGCSPYTYNSYPWQIAGTNYPGGFYTPTPPVDVAALIGAACGTSVATVTLNHPVTNLVLHEVNLDNSTLTVGGTTVGGAPIALKKLSSNAVNTLTGNTINAVPHFALNGGCQANDGTNPAGACGSFQLPGTVSTFTLTNTGSNDGWILMFSFDTLTDGGATTTTPEGTSVTTPLSSIVTEHGTPADPASVTTATLPAHGTIAVDPTTGAVTYTPKAGYVGTDSYQVNVCDTNKACTVATVLVTVTPKPTPTATPTPTPATAAPASTKAAPGIAVETGGSTPPGSDLVGFWALVVAGLTAAAMSIVVFARRTTRS